MAVRNELGRRFRVYMAEQKVSLTFLAEYTGIKYHTLNRWITGAFKPTKQNMEMLREKFPDVLGDCSYEQLVSRIGDGETNSPAATKKNTRSGAWIGNDLRQFAAEKGFNKSQCATFLGVARSVLATWWQDRVQPSKTHLQRLREKIPNIGNHNALPAAENMLGASQAPMSTPEALVKTSARDMPIIADIKTNASITMRVDISANSLDESVEALRRFMGRAEPEQPSHDTPRAIIAAQSMDECPDLYRSIMLHSLAHMLTAALPIAKLIASNEFSIEERADLRERAGAKTIFELSNMLNALCGERARALASDGIHNGSL